MKQYRFDTEKWILTSLPPIMRRPVLYGIVKSCMAPLKLLFQDLRLYIGSASKRLLARPYVGTLEALLNAEMGYPQGTIYIRESSDENSYLGKKGQDPEALFLGRTPDVDTLYLARMPNNVFKGFIVWVPGRAISVSEADKNYRRIVELIENYKMPGVGYRIESYE